MVSTEQMFRGLTQIVGREWAGWYVDSEDPFNLLVGPFYVRGEGDNVRCAFRPERRHMNGHGYLHGGCIMSFARYSISMIAGLPFKGQIEMTPSFNCDFSGTVKTGELVESVGEITRSTRSFIFVRTLITVKGEVALSASAVLQHAANKRGPIV